MIPANFDYLRVDSVEGAINALSEHGDEAKLLAGGHSLLPLMKFRLAAPAYLVDINRLDELKYVREQDGHLLIGALTRHCDIESNTLIKENAGLLATATHHVGDPQVRNRGTIGGSLCHGDPASDLPAVVLATRASLIISGPNGQRSVEADDFFTDFWETAVSEDELLTEIQFPKYTGEKWSFQKFNRRAQDWAIVGCALQHGENSGIGMINMGSTPVRAAASETALNSGESNENIAGLADDGLTPPSDIHGQQEYRRHLSKVLLGRALDNS